MAYPNVRRGEGLLRIDPLPTLAGMQRNCNEPGAPFTPHICAGE